MKAYFAPATALAVMILASADAAQAAEPLELRRIMKDLGKNMQVITDAISREDWALVERTSPLIADHPQPPVAEKLRIMAFIGTRMSKFKSFDDETHKAAGEMRVAAREENGPAIISSFQKIQLSCLGCHQSFRRDFIEHFYGKTAAQ